MNTLIYRRTHRGDPDDSKTFGVHNCMGQVRDWTYDSVIGIGGISPDPGHEDIAKRITWVGVGAHRQAVAGGAGTVTFDSFLRLDEVGPYLCELSPLLDDYMFGRCRIPRAGLSNSLSPMLQHEIRKILTWAFDNGRPKQKPESLPTASPQSKQSCQRKRSCKPVIGRGTC